MEFFVTTWRTHLVASKKFAVITGASQGIGASVAETLAGAGYELLLIARNKEKLEAVRASLTNPDTHQVLSLDVTDRELVAKELPKKLKPVAVLFHSAGLFEPARWNAEDEVYDRLIELNLRGTISVCRAVRPYLQPGANLITMSSRRGKVAAPSEAVYATTKFAVTGLNEAMFAELVPAGVRVTTICPGWVNTKMALDAEMTSEEMLTTQDIGKTVLFLAELGPQVAVKEVFLEPRRNLSRTPL